MLHAAYDKRLLCRLNVEFLVNASGLDLDRLPAKLKPTLVPRCMCQASEAGTIDHPRTFLDVFSADMHKKMPITEVSRETV